MNIKLKCIECEKEYDAKEIRYRCECGELLEVVPDLKAFKRSGKEWKEHFEKGKDHIAFLRYKDVLLPDLPDNKVISLDEGDTPLYKANKKLKEFFGVDNLYLKHEGRHCSLRFNW
jgi:threonine synthase